MSSAIQPEVATTKTRIQKAPVTQIPSSARLHTKKDQNAATKRKEHLLKSGVNRRMEGVMYNTQGGNSNFNKT